MHSVVAEDPSHKEFRQTQLVFAVRNECFGESGDPVAVEVAGLDSLFVEPFERWSMTFLPPRGGETTGAYALPIGDRTLCVYLTWDPTTTEKELAAGREIVESIRGQPYGEDGIRINFTLPPGWDTGRPEEVGNTRNHRRSTGNARIIRWKLEAQNHQVPPGEEVFAPSAGFEPATPGLGNLLCIRASEHPKTPMRHRVFAFSRVGAFRCSVSGALGAPGSLWLFRIE